jgi:hypothetical protein
VAWRRVPFEREQTAEKERGSPDSTWRRRRIRRHEADSADLVATRYEAVLAVAAPGSVADPRARGAWLRR